MHMDLCCTPLRTRLSFFAPLLFISTLRIVLPVSCLRTEIPQKKMKTKPTTLSERFVSGRGECVRVKHATPPGRKLRQV